MDIVKMTGKNCDSGGWIGSRALQWTHRVVISHVIHSGMIAFPRYADVYCKCHRLTQTNTLLTHDHAN